MMKHTILGIVAAGLIATAGTVSASTGEALACPFQLGETCAMSGHAAIESLRIPIAPPVAASAAPTAGSVQVAGGGCGAAAAAAAAAQGGQVIGAPRTVQQGNQTMCVVTVLIKDPSGKSPPTRRQITVPAN